MLEGYNLTLQGVTTRDQGEYICEVGGSTNTHYSSCCLQYTQVETEAVEPIRQENILSVLVPATVEPLPHSGHISCHVILSCHHVLYLLIMSSCHYTWSFYHVIMSCHYRPVHSQGGVEHEPGVQR